MPVSGGSACQCWGWLLDVCCVCYVCGVLLCCVGSSAEWATLRYPENLTISNMLYYLAVPTLTYQVCRLFWRGCVRGGCWGGGGAGQPACPGVVPGGWGRGSNLQPPPNKARPLWLGSALAQEPIHPEVQPAPCFARAWYQGLGFTSDPNPRPSQRVGPLRLWVERT